jgi:hypothetical protein
MAQLNRRPVNDLYGTGENARLVIFNEILAWYK